MYRFERCAAAFLAMSLLFVSCRGGQEQTPSGAVTVKVMTVAPSDAQAGPAYVGTVSPSKSATLTAPYSGTLVSVDVRQGQYVNKGDVIARIESQSVISSLQSAEAKLAQARDGYQRLASVHESGSVADVKMVEIQTQLAQAEAMEAAARAALEDCTIKAPYSGVIGSVLADEGVSLSIAAPIARIMDVSSVEIRISIPEGELSSVARGDAATVTVPALDDIAFPARVSEKGIAASALSHTYDCVLVPSGKCDGLLPGMVCKVRMQPKDGERLISIPASAVRNGSEGRYVWTVSEGRVGKRMITVGGFSDEGVVVTSGLESGDRIIVEGVRKVSTGMSVSIVE